MRMKNFNEFMWSKHENMWIVVHVGASSVMIFAIAIALVLYPYLSIVAITVFGLILFSVLAKRLKDEYVIWKQEQVDT